MGPFSQDLGLDTLVILASRLLQLGKELVDLCNRLAVLGKARREPQGCRKGTHQLELSEPIHAL